MDCLVLFGIVPVDVTFVAVVVDTVVNVVVTNVGILSTSIFVASSLWVIWGAGGASHCVGGV